ncbi:hypothetical protein [Salinarimonas soli]|uniref:Uncharacterized protein n=1 Tax=Salinarimonas soli TaxID=1638099 RepID=A0A5B2VCG3_9HYPH|nr:hypothetical protein [Salinarimonas soli]KAA2235989.1 hypothetical protein F0L46_17150 [Salinarimonas soli]
MTNIAHDPTIVDERRALVALVTSKSPAHHELILELAAARAKLIKAGEALEAAAATGAALRSEMQEAGVFPIQSRAFDEAIDVLRVDHLRARRQLDLAIIEVAGAHRILLNRLSGSS